MTNPTPTTPAAAARELARNIISETQLIDNTWQEAHKLKIELVELITQALLSARQAALTEAADIARSKKVHLTFEQLIKSDTDYSEYNYGIDQVVAALDAAAPLRAQAAATKAVSEKESEK